MSVYVSLHIDPEHIDSDRWRTVYQQTLQLLKAWQGDLFAARQENRGPHTRTVLSRKLLCHNGQRGDSCWTVCGDFESKQYGEPFVLHADLNQYRHRGSQLPMATTDDILSRIVGESTPNYAKVFHQKTQGLPYHIVVLAAAMWIEHNFPKSAFLSGDIDKAQCQKAARYISNNLGEEVLLPVCVSPDQLLSRLSYFSDGFERLDYFIKVYRGTYTESLSSLFQYVDQGVVSTWFARELQKYGDPNQFGAIDWFNAWLNACEDLEALCYLACVNENGPRFPASSFGTALAATWIGVPRSHREVIDAFHRPEGEPETVHSQFGGIFLDMSGLKGRHIQAYLPMAQIVSVLHESFSQQAHAVIANFQEKQEEAIGLLAQIKEPAEALAYSRDDALIPIMDGMEFMNIGHPAGLSEKYTTWLDVMAKLVYQWRQDASHYASSNMDHASLIDLLWHLADRNHIVLSEDAWSWLEEEEDLELLLTAAALMSQTDNEEKFVNIRWAVLENRSLCDFVGNRSYEDLMVEEEKIY